jgi:hypothetical protein
VTRDGGTSFPLDAATLLGRVAGRLGRRDAGALAGALDVLVTELGLRSVVLRAAAPPAADGTLLAVAGDVVHAVPLRRPPAPCPTSVVEVAVHAAGSTVAALTVVGARPSQLPTLRACAAVLGLAVVWPSPWTLGADLLGAADDEADDVADALHDGPVQDLVAARYAADVALRGGDARAARDAVQHALQSLRRTLWMLRPRSGDGLAAALHALSDRLVEAGRPALVLHLDDDACAALPAPAAAVAYRLVQAAARDESPITVRVAADIAAVRVEVTSGFPLATPRRWISRAAALGARLDLPTRPDGAVVLTVPVPTSETSTVPTLPLDPSHHLEATP